MPRYIGAYRGGVRPPVPTPVYRTCALSLPCHSEGAKRPWESVPLFISTAALAATYLCRSAAKARFDNRQNPWWGFQRGGPQPSLFGRFKRKGFLRKGGNRNPPFLKWRSLVTFFRQGKKVTRRRQKGKGQKKEKSCTGGQRRPPLQPPTEHTPFHKTSPSFYHISLRRATSPPAPALCKPILSPISSTIRLLRAKLAQIYAKYARLAPGRNCKPPLRNGILYQ